MTKMYRMSLITMTLILGGAVLQSANAQSPAGASPSYASDAPLGSQEPAPVIADWLPPGQLLRVRTSDQGIRYISGGVGESERTELNAQSNQFNLRLLFAMQGSGEYLSAVRVNILDQHGGTVLTAESKGPWFFTQLAPGDYTVEASATDQGQPSLHQQTTHIENSGQSKLDFYWR